MKPSTLIIGCVLACMVSDAWAQVGSLGSSGATSSARPYTPPGASGFELQPGSYAPLTPVPPRLRPSQEAAASAPQSAPAANDVSPAPSGARPLVDGASWGTPAPAAPTPPSNENR
jgi:hypothetical protein